MNNQLCKSLSNQLEAIGWGVLLRMLRALREDVNRTTEDWMRLRAYGCATAQELEMRFVHSRTLADSAAWAVNQGRIRSLADIGILADIWQQIKTDQLVCWIGIQRLGDQPEGRS